jgi:hypothetical protein
MIAMEDRSFDRRRRRYPAAAVASAAGRVATNTSWLALLVLCAGLIVLPVIVLIVGIVAAAST